MRAFLKKQHPGLGDKLAWFYNEYVARVKAVSKDDFKRKGVYRKVRTRFPGFANIDDAKRYVSQGRELSLDDVASCLMHSSQLMQFAADYVGHLAQARC